MTTPLTDWRPTPADVATLIPHRTGDPDGEARTSFRSDTVPSEAQVEGVIRGVQSEVSTRIGDMPAALVAIPSGGTIGDSPAGHVVALGAAARVEWAFYPDLQLNGQGHGTMLDEWYKAALADLATAANDAEEGTDPGAPLMPTATFPAACPIQWAQL